MSEASSVMDANESKDADRAYDDKETSRLARSSASIAVLYEASRAADLVAI